MHTMQQMTLPMSRAKKRTVTAPISIHGNNEPVDVLLADIDTAESDSVVTSLVVFCMGVAVAGASVTVVCA